MFRAQLWSGPTWQLEMHVTCLGAISRSARWREAFSFSCRIGRREMRVAEIEIWNFTAMLYATASCHYCLLCHTHAYNWSFTTAKGYLYYSSIISFTWTGHPFVIAKESLSTLRPQHQVEAICRSNLQRLLLLCGHLRTQKVLLPGNLVIISCNNLNRSRTLISMRCSTMILLYRDTSSPITTGF